MTPDDREDRLFWAGIAGVVPIAVTSLLVPVREHVASANLALVLMGVLVLLAATGGRTAGAVAAIVTTMSFDFFLTKPYLTMRMESGDDVETATILLIVGLAVGTLAARARSARAAAQAGKAEIARLHRIAELVVSDAPVDDVIEATKTELTSLLELRGCTFVPSPPAPALTRLERSGVLARPSGPIARYRMGRHGLELPADGAVLPVLACGEEVASFVLSPTPGVGASLEQRVVAVTLADQVGAALSDGRARRPHTSPPTNR